ncbi:MAG: molybdopterin-dependent oxidoreductase [Acidaminococcus sp.]|jgi:anaerobic selenocysteine-containing dehydrogenase|nr:molybdopterin-dependent oxidoreductase [Acidaminococcus sp.]MCI2100433.1 molybdopterin-dependent oxidoreductase [Acidaminococcus sp.]MCI2114754.1 molybdopterin-dependent oxidoreductase [Acidaminococcus sp.]MCI2116826.1 molybdopterin-dependent oxidoreductase [Acidaminococcus sp.]
MGEKKYETKHLVCKVCDNDCTLEADLEDGKLIRLRGVPDPSAICSKVRYWNEYIHNPSRIIHPLKNVGSNRGEQKWERISWDQALDEIAQKMMDIKKKYGAESIVFSGTETNQGRQQGMWRRFANVIGTPNWITGQHLCLGNTLQVHRLTYGTHIMENYAKANCILLVGHNPHPNNWAGEYAKLKKARARGAKLIVLDPRPSINARDADIHLRLRFGTDAAMLLGFLNVILNEGLYDKAFVEKYCYGFDELKKRADEYPLERVAEITECKAEDIAKAARMYATEGPSIIPWGPIPDMQVNSTSLIRLQDILMSVCGYLNKSEILSHYDPDIEPVSNIERYDLLSPEQQSKLLGTEEYPLFSYKGYEPFKEPNKRVYGLEYYNLLASFMANPPATFRAMRTGKPYPIKALFNSGTNTLMSYCNQNGIYEGLMNLDLIVVFDHWMTPTAQLADYVLPSDYYLERIGFRQLDHTPSAITQQQVLKPVGEVKHQYFVIKGLADRMGLGKYFPWKDFEEVIDWRIRKTGKTFKEISKQHVIPPSRTIDPLATENGFATPTGKIELYSTALKWLGYDPLPYYREPEQSQRATGPIKKEYPLEVFVGIRDGFNYLTNLRQIPSLRKKQPWPEVFLHPDDVAKYGLKNHQWIWVESVAGRLKAMVKSDPGEPVGTIRVPHGWWFPELPGGPETAFSGAMECNDGLIIPDDDWNLDREQGVVGLRGGFLAKVYPADPPAHFKPEGPDEYYHVVKTINE